MEYICVTNDHGHDPFVVNINRVLSSFMTYQRVCNKSSTMGVTCGAGTAYTSVKHELTPLFSAFMLLAP